MHLRQRNHGYKHNLNGYNGNNPLQQRFATTQPKLNPDGFFCFEKEAEPAQYKEVIIEADQMRPSIIIMLAY